jgi:hypothetical protein
LIFRDLSLRFLLWPAEIGAAVYILFSLTLSPFSSSLAAGGAEEQLGFPEATQIAGLCYFPDCCDGLPGIPPARARSQKKI